MRRSLVRASKIGPRVVPALFIGAVVLGTAAFLLRREWPSDSAWLNWRTWQPHAVRGYEGLKEDRPTTDEFPNWLREQVRKQEWARHPGYGLVLNGQTLEESLRLGRQYLINNQSAAGNFNYSYDFVARKLDRADNQVRQAGALWGLSILNHHQPSEEVRRTLDRGLDFFVRHTVPSGEDKALAIAYPGDAECKSGTVALTGLAIIEYLRVWKEGSAPLSDARRRELERTLDGYLRHLELMQLQNKHFSDSWSLAAKIKSSTWNPYSDGEAFLCMIKAAKYLGRSQLVPLIEDTTLELARYYTTDQWQSEPDSELTKGFFQWSCLAFWEYRNTGWKHASISDDYLLALGWWMLHVHRVLDRSRNTGYAFEGVIPGYVVAKERGDRSALEDLAWTIDRGLTKLTSWQVGVSLAKSNAFLAAHPTQDPLAIGGIMNGRNEAALRIDVTQHQMHAVVLALKHVYGRQGGTKK